MVDELRAPLLVVLIPDVASSIGGQDLMTELHPLEHLDPSGQAQALLDSHAEELVRDGLRSLGLACHMNERMVGAGSDSFWLCRYHLLRSLINYVVDLGATSLI